MSSLPPAGRPLVPNAEPVKNEGQMEPGYGKHQVERRKRVSDRRSPDQQAGGGRRVGEADRRKAVETETNREAELDRLQPSGEDLGGKEGEFSRKIRQHMESSTSTVDDSEGRKPEPVHLHDDQGRIQPNPKASVEGATDIDRLRDAARKGVPAGTAEMKELGVPSGGISDVSHVQLGVTDRESGKVRAGIGEVDNSQAEKPSAEGTGAKFAEPGSQQAAAEELAQLGQQHVEEATESSQPGNSSGLSDRELVDGERTRAEVAQDHVAERRIAQRRTQLLEAPEPDGRSGLDRRRE